MSKSASTIRPKGTNQIEAEAASWVAQLDRGVFSHADRLALAEWIGRSPQHEATLRRLAAVWGDVDELLDEALQTEERSTISSVVGAWITVRPLQFSAYALPALIAVFLAGAFAVFQFNQDAPSGQVAVLEVDRGKHRSIELRDGSRIHLNTDSSAEVHYADDARTIRLVRGEAWFDVVHDPSRPFRVFAGKGVVEAIGTSFVVRLHKDELDVTVTDGTIKLVKLDQPASVAGAFQAPDPDNVTATYVDAGYRARLSGAVSKVETLDEHEMEKQTAWRDGLLIFEGDRLADVISELNRYTAARIVIMDPQLADLRIGGTFAAGEVDAVLSALQSSAGIEIDRVGSDLIYLSKKNTLSE